MEVSRKAVNMAEKSMDVSDSRRMAGAGTQVMSLFILLFGVCMALLGLAACSGTVKDGNDNLNGRDGGLPDPDGSQPVNDGAPPDGDASDPQGDGCVPSCSDRCGGPDGCGGTCPSTCTDGLVCRPPDYTFCGAASSVEFLGRGLVALPKDGGIYTGWRLLPWDDPAVGFNIYRATSPTGPFSLRNTSPVVASTNYHDGSAQAGTTYYYVVRTIDSNGEGPDSNLARVVAGSDRSDIAIPMQPNAECPAGRNWYYHAWGGVAPGDINGDGVLDFVVLFFDWDSNHPFCIEAFVSGDGGWTSRWRKSTGLPGGIYTHTTGVVLWDLDGDGRAEIVTRTGPNGDLSVLDPENGSVLHTTPWHYAQGQHSFGNLVPAYLEDLTGDGLPEPFIVTHSAMYSWDRPRFAAFTYDSQLGLTTRRDVQFGESFDANHPFFVGMGTHAFVVADLTNDGLDEVLPCGAVLYTDWSGYFVVSPDHSDVCHPADISPARSGPELLVGDGNMGYLVSFAQGFPEVLWTVTPDLPSGWDKGWCADLTDTPGMECVMMDHTDCDEGHVPCPVMVTRAFDAQGSEIAGALGFTMQYMAALDWQRGDGRKQGYDVNCGPTNPPYCMAGVWADVVGDAREEVLSLDFENNVLRIFSNTQVNPARYLTPLADRGYRNAVARLGCYSYNKIATRSNQPRHDMIPGATEAVGGCDSKPAGHVCRPAAGPCDVPETCDGIQLECPVDLVAASGTVCRPSTEACDPAEQCDGASVACPVDVNGCHVCVVGACASTDGVFHAGAGMVFTSTACAQAPPTASVHCAASSACTAGACSGTRYYHACNGAGACRSDTTGAASATVLADSCKVLNAVCASVDPGLGLFCDSQSEPISDCVCQVYFRGCTGSGACRGDNTCATEWTTSAPSGTKFIAGCYTEPGPCP